MLPYLASPERGCWHQGWRFWGGSKPFTCLTSSTWLGRTSWMVWKLISATKNIIFMLIVFKMSSSYWSFTSRRASSFRRLFSSLALLFDLERFQLLLEREAPAPQWVCHRSVPQSLSPSSSPVVLEKFHIKDANSPGWSHFSLELGLTGFSGANRLRSSVLQMIYICV